MRKFYQSTNTNTNSFGEEEMNERDQHKSRISNESQIIIKHQDNSMSCSFSCKNKANKSILPVPIIVTHGSHNANTNSEFLPTNKRRVKLNNYNLSNLSLASGSSLSSSCSSSCSSYVQKKCSFILNNNNNNNNISRPNNYANIDNMPNYVSTDLLPISNESSPLSLSIEAATISNNNNNKQQDNNHLNIKENKILLKKNSSLSSKTSTSSSSSSSSSAYSSIGSSNSSPAPSPNSFCNIYYNSNLIFFSCLLLLQSLFPDILISFLLIN
jgi:hypothetical protein